MVNVFNQLLKARSEQIADKRHQRLKPAEIQSDADVMPCFWFSCGKSLANGDGKGIHGKPDGENEKLDKAQKITFSAQKSVDDGCFGFTFCQPERAQLYNLLSRNFADGSLMDQRGVFMVRIERGRSVNRAGAR